MHTCDSVCLLDYYNKKTLDGTLQILIDQNLNSESILQEPTHSKIVETQIVKIRIDLTICEQRSLFFWLLTALLFQSHP